MTALLDIEQLVPDIVERVAIPFGEWLPDLPELNNPGAVEALNVLPVEGNYTPFASHVYDGTNFISGQIIGAAAVVSEKDIVQLFAGTPNIVYSSIGGGFIDVYVQPVSADFAWKFIRVNDVMVGVHPEAFPIQSALTGAITAFNVIGGNPPKAECGAQVGDFLMLGNLHDDPDDGHGSFPTRIRWGGFNNISSPWISDPVTQADFQDMPGAGGPVRAISGREYGTIYQERSISRAVYRGLPSVFEIATVEDKRGCIARDSIVDVGPVQFGIAEDGFFIWNGTNTELIGNNKVNRYFFNRLQYAQRSRICGAADFINGCVVWAFPTDTSGLLTELIVYSYKENRFSHSIQTLEYLFESAKSSVTVDALTLPLEDYTGSFDSDFYRNGGLPSLAAFNELGQYGFFNGDNMAAILETGESTGPEGRRVFVNNVRPLVDLAVPQATIQAIFRDQMIGQPSVYSLEATQEIDGQCPLTADGRYMRFRVNIPAGATWRHAIGVEIARKPSGVF